MCVAIVRRERRAQRLDEREDQLAARGRRLVDPVDRPVARVADMMIDVEHRRAVEAGDAGAIERAALHDERAVVRSRSTSRAIAMSPTCGKRLQKVRRRRVHDDVGRLAHARAARAPCRRPTRWRRHRAAGARRRRSAGRRGSRVDQTDRAQITRRLRRIRRGRSSGEVSSGGDASSAVVRAPPLPA